MGEARRPPEKEPEGEKTYAMVQPEGKTPQQPMTWPEIRASLHAMSSLGQSLIFLKDIFDQAVAAQAFLKERDQLLNQQEQGFKECQVHLDQITKQIAAKEGELASLTERVAHLEAGYDNAKAQYDQFKASLQ